MWKRTSTRVVGNQTYSNPKQPPPEMSYEDRLAWAKVAGVTIDESRYEILKVGDVAEWDDEYLMNGSLSWSHRIDGGSHMAQPEVITEKSPIHRRMIRRAIDWNDSCNSFVPVNRIEIKNERDKRYRPGSFLELISQCMNGNYKSGAGQLLLFMSTTSMKNLREFVADVELPMPEVGDSCELFGMHCIATRDSDHAVQCERKIYKQRFIDSRTEYLSVQELGYRKVPVAVDCTSEPKFFVREKYDNVSASQYNLNDWVVNAMAVDQSQIGRIILSNSGGRP